MSNHIETKKAIPSNSENRANIRYNVLIYLAFKKKNPI